ncbi:MAG: YezD family protein [Chakrabartia sp.]
MTNIKDHSGAPAASAKRPEGLQLVEEALARLRFGVINLTVHDGKLVQLDITERKRFPA